MVNLVQQIYKKYPATKDGIKWDFKKNQEIQRKQSGIVEASNIKTKSNMDEFSPGKCL